MLKKRFAILLVIGILAALLLGACQSGASNVQTLDAVSVVQGYYDAFNNKKIDQAVSFLADDALFINPVGTFEGKAAIQEHLAGLANDGLGFNLSEFKNNNGRVNYSYEVLINGEVVEVGTDGLTIVKDGKIVFDGTESTAPQP